MLRIVVIPNLKDFLGLRVPELTNFIIRNHLNNIVIEVVPRYPELSSSLGNLVLVGGWTVSPEELIAVLFKNLFERLCRVKSKIGDIDDIVFNLIALSFPNIATFSFKQALFTGAKIANLSRNDAPVTLLPEALGGLFCAEDNGLLHLKRTNKSIVFFGEIGGQTQNVLAAERTVCQGRDRNSKIVNMKVLKYDGTNFGGRVVDKIVLDHFILCADSDEIIPEHNWKDLITNKTPDWAKQSIIHFILYSMGYSEESTHKLLIEVRKILCVTNIEK